MNEALSIETEGKDDIPLLLTHIQSMWLAELLDKHISTHGQRKGLSVGELSAVWLVHISRIVDPIDGTNSCGSSHRARAFAKSLRG
jgi:hypothetical protein